MGGRGSVSGVGRSLEDAAHPSTGVWAAAGALGRGLAAAAALLAFSWWAAPPASAHEFSVVVVSARSAESVDAGRGFRLAVDESPDVSHAPGSDAGDHLGGVDVDLVAVEDGEDSRTADLVGDLLDEGASAVVVLLVPSTADAIAAAAAERDKLALVVEDGGTSRIPNQSLLLRPRDAGNVDEAGVAAATMAFREAFGDEPTPAALLGYDAGRLLDTIVARIGHVLRPTEPLIAAALAGDAELTSSRAIAAGAAEGEDAEPGGRATGESGDGADIRRSAVLAAAALVAAGAVVVMVRRRRS